MNDPVEYLKAAHRRAELLAQAATRGPWFVDSTVYAERIYGAGNTDVVAGGRWGGEASVFGSTEDALHIAVNLPDKTLARVEAERDLLVEHAPDEEHWPECVRCVGVTRDVEVGGGMTVRAFESAPWPCRPVRLLAAGWGWTEES